MRISGRKALPGGRTHSLLYPPFSKIRIGEPDANAEYFAGLRSKREPIFLDCFFTIPNFPSSQFESGEKYLIYGQKGTGKTAALRYLETSARALGTTEFLIFKKSFLEEID